MPPRLRVNRQVRTEARFIASSVVRAVVSGTSGQVPGNLFRPLERGKCFPAPRLFELEKVLRPPWGATCAGSAGPAPIKDVAVKLWNEG